jgi:hypothetical protein
MQVPCVYIPGPAPAVSVANTNCSGGKYGQIDNLHGSKYVSLITALAAQVWPIDTCSVMWNYCGFLRPQVVFYVHTNMYILIRLTVECMYVFCKL